MEAKKTPSMYGDRDSERGAGGKLRRPPTRKSQATPYDRPLTNQHARGGGGGGWLSKIVDPARRLVAGGATMIFPSFFSKTPAATETPDIEEGDVKSSDEGNEECTVIHDVSQITERSGPSEVATNISKRNCRSDELEPDKLKSFSDDSQISRIEQLIKGKTFSRDEINRLMEIVNSKVTDVSDLKKERKNEILSTAGHTEGLLLTPFSETIDEGNHEDTKNASISSVTLLPMPSVPDEIGASPVDIARAYMGSRISEHGSGPYNASSKGETAPQLSDEFASKPFMPSSAPRPSTRWPGAMAQEPLGYTTPNHRGRHSLHDFPRTPYSRTIYSKSRAKLAQSQADSGFLSTSSYPFKQSQMPLFEQMKSRHHMSDNSYGSVGPIRHMRNKFASEARPRGSIFLKSSKDAPPIQQPIASQGLLPDLGKNLKTGETSTSKQQPGDYAGNSFGKNPLLNSSSGQAVKRILEQLDRKKPTPQEKADELRIATSWKKCPPEAAHAMLKENVSFSHPGEFGSLKETGLFDPKLLSEDKKLGGNANSQVESQERSIEANDAVMASSEAPSIADSIVKSDATNGPLFSFKSSSSPQLKSFQEKPSLHSPFQNQSNVQHVITSPIKSNFEPSKKPPLHLSRTRPILPNIYVGRHDLSRAVSSDNGAGFTFPFSASSGILSEPPTPSVMPFSSSGMVSQPKEEVPTIPAYSFGTKKSTPPLIFSFPSTSNPPAHIDTHDLKFSFGSDKKTRLSFGSVGKDALCY